MQILTGPKKGVRGIAFSPDGNRAAACDTTGKVVIWDVD